MNEDKMVEIFSGTLWEAEMIKNLLKNVEINSFIGNSTQNSNEYNPIIASGVKVMIFNADSGKAKIIVDQYYKNMKNDL